MFPWKEGLTVFVLIALAYQWFLFSSDNATSAAFEGGKELGARLDKGLVNAPWWNRM